MAEPVKLVTFGGATFNQNDIASQTTTKKNGKTYYVVNFKAGATAQYPMQSSTNGASITHGTDWYDNSVNYDIKRFCGLEFTSDTRRGEDVTLRGCNGCTIDVTEKYSPPNRDLVILENDGAYVSYNNTVIMEKDVVTEVIPGLFNDHTVSGSGVHHEGDR